MGNILILISCSHDKNSENGEFTTENFINSISENREKFLDKRKEIKKLIQDGKVEDRELREGNRKERKENIELIDGPDFGGSNQEKRYLPAYKRYQGRFFSQLDEKDWHTAKEKGYHILIISGLYGLLSFNDSIQAYNCHLTDIIGDIREQGTLGDYWVDTLTGGLKEYIEKNNIDMIIDLISEESYQHSIKWEEEIEKMQLRILHRVFEKAAGAGGSFFLSNLGLFFKNDIVNKSPEEVRNIKVSKPGSLNFIERDYFKGNDRIIFESKLYELGFDDVARELDRDIERWIKLRFGNYWDLLNEGEKYYVMDGKKIFEDFQKGKFNTNVSSVHSWWTATESVRNRFLDRLGRLFYSRGYRKIFVPDFNSNTKKIVIKEIILERDESSYFSKLSPFNTELLLSYCYNLEGSHLDKDVKDKLKVTVGNMRNFIKDHSIFSSFTYAHTYKQRELRNAIQHRSIQMDSAKRKVEEFHNLFFNKEKSVLIAYLKLIHAIPK